MRTFSKTLGCAVLALAAMASRASSQDLTGAGSTFVNPIMTKWIYDYRQATGISINYQAVGSGAGISNLIDGTIDFAGSDAPMTAEQKGRAKGDVIHLPDVIGPVAISYNIPGIGTGLGFSGPILADIFLGKIKYWDDPQIVARNPGKNLPHEQIFVVHRSDGSGTTAIFTDYLSKVSPEWKSKVGSATTVSWPTGLGGKGSAGVAAILQQHPFSIGYVEFAYVEENKIPYAAMDDGTGNYVYPSAESAMQAAQSSTIAEDLCTMITAAPKGYPISGMSWLIVYKKSLKAPELRKFLKYVLTTGQKDTKALWYASIPPEIVSRELKLIDSIE